MEIVDITDRQKSILEKLIREHIRSAKPVSSEYLEKKANLGVCPATIRNEMQKLTNDGYLSQPHTSAGRIPTDKGYRFFVDNILEADVKKNFFDISKIIDGGFDEEEDDVLKLIETLTKRIASASSSLAFVYLFNRDIMWKEGFKEVFQNPEFREIDFVEEFLETADFFGEKMREEADKGFDELSVYIGNEKSLLNSDDFSLIISRGKFADDEEGILAILGPKRMEYQRNIGILNSLIKELEKN